MEETSTAPLTDTPPLVTLCGVPGRLPDPDEPLRENVGKRGLPVRVRMPLHLKDGQGYNAWPGMSWLIEFQTAESVVEFRQALDEFVRGWVKWKVDVQPAAAPAVGEVRE